MLKSKINNATNILIGLIAGFTVLMLVYAGFMFITARGEVGKTEKAQRALRYAIYGLIVGILAYTIVNAVVRFLL